ALREGDVKLGGLTLHHTWGGSGSPIVFIHGLGSSGYIEWRFNLDHFAARHRVFAPDLPGFGRSDKPASARYGIPYFARSIDRYMANRRLRSATVVGTSMGGRVALELALAYPTPAGCTRPRATRPPTWPASAPSPIRAATWPASTSATGWAGSRRRCSSSGAPTTRSSRSSRRPGPTSS